ncbi:MAG TPA: hypothetical protein PLU22_00955 [Polyangiaceae bacterium]|nr:hypothetical protein [Polyangiaceae bacterium]
MQRNRTVYSTEPELRRATLAWCERRFRESWGVEWSAVGHVIGGLAWEADRIGRLEAHAAEVRERLRVALADAVEVAAEVGRRPRHEAGAVAARLARVVEEAGLARIAKWSALRAPDLAPDDSGGVIRRRLVRAVHLADWGGWTARGEPFPRFTAGDLAVISLLSDNWPSVALPAKVEDVIERERKAIDPHLRRLHKMTDWTAADED